MLIIYGIAFIVIEKRKNKLKVKVTNLSEITYQMAFFIGAFQVLSLIPGTSRSGATIIGAMLIGASRFVATEFTFFLAVPVMFGASFIKLIKFGLDFNSTELIVLVVGMVTAFLVSVFAIKFLLNYIKRNSFVAFGWYRIVLGCLVLGYFVLA
jgi:undecaprenyl-diphosphatase